MISERAAVIRASIEPECVEPERTLDDERQLWEDATRHDGLAAGTTESGDTIGGRPVLWIEPTGSSSTSPVIVYLHGGGLTTGSPRTHRAFASRLAVTCGVALVVVDYRLLPDSAFPDPLDDVVAVVEGLQSSGRTPAHRIVLAGDSNGAALAFSAACVMRDRSADAVAGIVSVSGAFDATLSGASVDAGRDPQLSRAVLEHWQQTVSTAVDLRDPLMSPVFASLQGLPPSLLLAGGDDVWLSDSIRLADELSTAGSSVVLRVFDGMWHVWPMHGDFPEARCALDEIAEFVAGVLS